MVPARPSENLIDVEMPVAVARDGSPTRLAGSPGRVCAENENAASGKCLTNSNVTSRTEMNLPEQQRTLLVLALDF